MLNYRNWKLLEESFGGVLGIKAPNNIGMVSNLAGTEASIEEAKAKKKMLEDDAVPTDEPSEEDDSEVSEEKPEEKEEDCSCDKNKKCSKMCCKNMKKESCDDDDDEDDDEDDDDDASEDDDLDGDDDGENDPDHKAKMKGKTLEMPLMMKKKMKKEHLENIKAQMSSDPQHKNWDGISKREDCLIAGQEEKIPGPGEVGYAPQTRFGVGAVQEWQDIAKKLGCGKKQ